MQREQHNHNENPLGGGKSLDSMPAYHTAHIHQKYFQVPTFEASQEYQELLDQSLVAASMLSNDHILATWLPRLQIPDKWKDPPGPALFFLPQRAVSINSPICWLAQELSQCPLTFLPPQNHLVCTRGPIQTPTFHNYNSINSTSGNCYFTCMYTHTHTHTLSLFHSCISLLELLKQTTTN
jgi:hypothetical protein